LPADLAWRREAIAAGLQRADAILAPSHSFASALHNVYGTGFAVSVVHNGRAAHDLPERPPRESFVLSAGRIWDEGKNFRLLDECAARLDMPVVAAGPGTGPNGMSASLLHLRFLGILDRWRLQTLYARAAAFVSPAKYEPFGLAVLEAALEETPLILSDIPTFRELWADAAIFCAPDDVDAFVAAIRRLAASSDERNRLGCAARGRALRYTPTAMINGVLEVYRSLPRQAASRAA
jgi:glycosyltransferase involved in cell wall biosynthesis